MNFNEDKLRTRVRLSSFPPKYMIIIDDLDANEIIPGLWIGSKPPKGEFLYKNGYTHVVLCSTDYQLPVSDFPNVNVIHCPFEDNSNIMSNNTMALVFVTAKLVAEAHKAGGKVLVTCYAGINRSALIAALALKTLGYSSFFAIESLRENRNKRCLENKTFERLVSGTNKSTEFYLG